MKNGYDVLYGYEALALCMFQGYDSENALKRIFPEAFNSIGAIKKGAEATTQEVIRLLEQGMTYAEISALVGLKASSLMSNVSKYRKKHGIPVPVQTRKEKSQ